MTEIQKADSRLRRNALLILIMGMLLGSIPLYVLHIRKKEVETWLIYNGEFLIKNPEIVTFILYLFALPIIAASVYFWFLSDRILLSKRFPPEGQKVIRNTVIHTGEAAIKRAYILKFLSVALFTTGLTLPILISYIINQLSYMLIM